MIMFYGEGRLGNQIFQYQALAKIAGSTERIFAVGLEDLQQIVDLCGPRLVAITRNQALKRAIKYGLIPIFMRPLARTLRLISYATESQSGVPPRRGPGGEFYRRSGLIRRVTFVDGGYYQNPSLWKSLFPAALVRVNARLRTRARHYLQSICGSPERSAFVHIRRRDYLSFQSYGLDDLSLPASYYFCAIDELKRQLGERHLVFVSDDAEWVKENFQHISNKTITTFDAQMDFAVMTECRAGIVSNSTFAMAAALMLSNPELVIAPKYWLGFRSGAWYPPKIHYRHPRMMYLSVEP